MRVIVLGGAGDMGSYIVRDLVKSGVETTIADINLEGAKKLSEELSDDVKVSFLYLDASDSERVSEIVSGYDVCVSSVGPFFKFERALAEACVKSKVNYVSICDDYDAVLSVYEISEKARKSDVVVLTGAGWTPGITNVLALYGSKMLDEVDRIDIAWSGAVDDAKGVAVIKHTFHIFLGKIPTYRNGELVWVRAGTEPENVNFPKPIGKCRVCNVGHPEPVTIPKYINVKDVTLRGGLTPTWIQRISEVMSKTPLKDRHIDSMVKAFMPALKRIKGVGVSGLVVKVKGKKGGRGMEFVFGSVDKMRRLTGIPASVISQMLAGGKIKIGGGVYSPEACVEPEIFFEELKKREIEIFEGEEFKRQI